VISLTTEQLLALAVLTFIADVVVGRSRIE
jgi:hypothetical protein